MCNKAYRQSNGYANNGRTAHGKAKRIPRQGCLPKQRVKRDSAILFLLNRNFRPPQIEIISQAWQFPISERGIRNRIKAFQKQKLIPTPRGNVTQSPHERLTMTVAALFWKDLIGRVGMSRVLGAAPEKSLPHRLQSDFTFTFANGYVFHIEAQRSNGIEEKLEKYRAYHREAPFKVLLVTETASEASRLNQKTGNAFFLTSSLMELRTKNVINDVCWRCQSGWVSLL